MKTMVLAGSDRLTRADLRAAGTLPASVISAAQTIVDDVRERGDEAVRAYTLKFDGSCPDSFRVSDDAVASARGAVSSEFLAALEHAAAQIREFHEREREQQMADIKGEMKKIEWGSQIRSYVFQPYTMVKDHRTNYESGNIDDVMNGNLEGFVTAYLKMQ